jgi:hypothetical protein
MGVMAENVVIAAAAMRSPVVSEDRCGFLISTIAVATRAAATTANVVIDAVVDVRAAERV